MNHQRLGQVYLENIPIEQRFCVDVEWTFIDLSGKRFRPDVVNRLTGEVKKGKEITRALSCCGNSTGRQLKLQPKDREATLRRLDAVAVERPGRP